MGALDENKREKRQIEEERGRSRSSVYFRPDWGDFPKISSQNEKFSS